jgi:hypothetical protein
MHRSDLADNDAIRWSGRPSAEKSARENVTADPPLPSLNHFISLPPRREREGKKWHPRSIHLQTAIRTGQKP